METIYNARTCKDLVWTEKRSVICLYAVQFRSHSLFLSMTYADPGSWIFFRIISRPRRTNAILVQPEYPTGYFWTRKILLSIHIEAVRVRLLGLATTKEDASLGSLRNRRSENRFSYVQRQTHKHTASLLPPPAPPSLPSLWNRWERNSPRALGNIVKLYYITHDVHTRDAHYQRVSTEMACRFRQLLHSYFGGPPRASLAVPSKRRRQISARISLAFYSAFIGSSPRSMYSRNYSLVGASTHRGDAGALIRGWRRRTRYPPRRPPLQPAEASAAGVPAATPTSARPSSSSSAA